MTPIAMPKLMPATQDDAEKIVQMLLEMAEETGELDLDEAVVRTAVERSFSEGVCWFLFEQNGELFGCTHCQSVFNYWRAEKRFYVGGFYIKPSFRGKGHFKNLNAQLKKWAVSHGGVQLYTHIHEDNARSAGAFMSVGFEPVEYKFYCNHWGD